MKVKLDIKSNAVDSLNESLNKYNLAIKGERKAYKFAVLHLTHAIELTLKMYLQTLNECLVFTKCFRAVKTKAAENKIDLLSAFHQLEEESFDFNALIDKDISPHTVNVGDVLSIAKHEKCSKTGVQFVDQNFIDDINWMKDLRNSIEHFEFEFTPKTVRLCIGRLMQGLQEFCDIFSIYDLEKEIGSENFKTFESLVDEYLMSLSEAHLDVKEAKESLFQGTRPKHRIFIEWHEYCCDSCGNYTMIPNDKSTTGYKCTLCGNEESGEIEVDCDVCGQPWANEDMSNWGEGLENVCPRCVDPESW